MLRNCKVDAVVVESDFCYNEITKMKEDFIMKLPDKIIKYRKANGWSQEDFAEKLNVSRSAIAKWETDGGIPEIDNLLQLSIVFGVSLDELVRNTKGQNNSKEADKYSENHDFGNQCYDIELAGWNDGVYGVYILTEDKDFLYYRYSDKANTIDREEICHSCFASYGR